VPGVDALMRGVLACKRPYEDERTQTSGVTGVVSRRSTSDTP